MCKKLTLSWHPEICLATRVKWSKGLLLRLGTSSCRREDWCQLYFFEWVFLPPLCWQPRFLDFLVLFSQHSVAKIGIFYYSSFWDAPLSVCMHRKSIFSSYPSKFRYWFMLYCISVFIYLKIELPNFVYALKILIAIVLLIGSFFSSFFSGVHIDR